MAETVARFRDAAVRYRDRTALGPLSLDLFRGDFLGVVGPNGAGKSTLLHLAAGAIPLSEGSLMVFGVSAGPGGKVKLGSYRRRIGFLLQHHDFLPDVPFTVEDVVWFGRTGLRRPGSRDRAEDARAVESALADLGLTSGRLRLYRELSGGERRKVQLARIIAQKAELVLLDEPAAGLDLDWQERMTCLVAELYRRYGSTVVMVTHDIDRLPSCCNRVLAVRDGEAVGFGPPDEVLRSELLSAVYGCPVEVIARGSRYFAFSLVPEG